MYFYANGMAPDWATHYIQTGDASGITQQQRHAVDLWRSGFPQGSEVSVNMADSTPDVWTFAGKASKGYIYTVMAPGSDPYAFAPIVDNDDDDPDMYSAAPCFEYEQHSDADPGL